MDFIDNISLTFRLITTSVLSLFNIVLPLEERIEQNIKRINTLLNINDRSNSENFHDEIQSEGSNTCDVAENSTGNSSDNGYDKVSNSSGNKSESDESEVSSK